MNGADSNRNSRTDVTFKPAGTGMSITRQCNARKGQWLCGARISVRGICDECAKARAEKGAK